MYPELLDDPADLVPLPNIDGPKLAPFDFQGPQDIQFIGPIASGLHGHVVEVSIHGRPYALKIFRFAGNINWFSLPEEFWQDREAMTAAANYQEPFNCECRAFGRLQESGHSDLAIGCYGYVLLDDAHEAAMYQACPELVGLMTGSPKTPDDSMRTRYSSHDGKLPPLRGIVKELGDQLDQLNTATANRIKRNVERLQQLGIINIDISMQQIINNKISDFSMALTAPHFMTSPELNPRLTPEEISKLRTETFHMARADYHMINNMVINWNWQHRDYRNRQVGPSAMGLPNRLTYERDEADGKPSIISEGDFGLRSRGRASLSTFVDPTRYAERRRDQPNTPWPLERWPPRWDYEGTEEEAAYLTIYPSIYQIYEYEYRRGPDGRGHIFPGDGIDYVHSAEGSVNTVITDEGSVRDGSAGHGSANHDGAPPADGAQGQHTPGHDPSPSVTTHGSSGHDGTPTPSGSAAPGSMGHGS